MWQVNCVLLRGLICLVAVLVASGCSRAPGLYPRVLMHAARVGSEFFLTAPNIVVVYVHSVKLLSPKFPLSGSSVLRLVQINADVETIITGGLRPGAITFYGFADRPPKEFRIYPEARYVVFLREDAGVLRTMADPDGDELRVHSGLHDTADLPDPRSTAARIMPCVDGQLQPATLAGMQIAYVLLTPGRNSDPDSLAQHLDVDVAMLWPRAPAEYVVWLLKQLQKNDDRRVRDRACIALAEHPAGAGADSCLVEVAKGPDPELRRRANEILAVHERNTGTLVETLKRWPAFLSPDVADLAARLNLLAGHRNEQVRSLACKALRSFFPACSFPKCEKVRVKPGQQ